MVDRRDTLLSGRALRRRWTILALCLGLAGALAFSLRLVGAHAFAQDARPWMDPARAPDARADAVLKAMTLQEEISLLHGHFPPLTQGRPAQVQLSGGWLPGVPRLGIPPLAETDASLGVAKAGRKDDDTTALPSGLALAASWDPDGVREAAAMIGREARRKGFGIMLAGGVNLVRDPFGGRAFEYLGEDPLLAGTLDGAEIAGVQSNHIVSTAKHFVLNAQETGRHVVDARISEAALRESDLLAFELALELGRPGSVMCSYNRVNGPYACTNAHLLGDVLKRDWRYPGWVMSDWAAVPSLDAARAGLDQQSGAELDTAVFFDVPLRAALAEDALPRARVDDMARRVLRSLFAVGLIDDPVQAASPDLAADGAVARKAAEAGMVLLKNDLLLPLAPGLRNVVVIGGRADIGVLSGGGSSQVIPKGSAQGPPDPPYPSWTRVVWHPSPPLAAIRARAPQARFVSGEDIQAAAAAARAASVAVLFLTEWSSEGADSSPTFDAHQLALADAVTRANPRTVVVLETGGPMLLPFASGAGAVMEAWYPGGAGGEAIARILFGEAAPGGRLPVTFPASLDQAPRPAPVGLGVAQPESRALMSQPAIPIDYREGSSVGYRWYAQTGARPAYPFGHGLTYTRFRYSDLAVEGGTTLRLSLTVSNVGARAGVETAQAYLAQAPDRTQLRLIGWRRVALAPGETRRIEMVADRRLLADWDEAAHGWRLTAGRYHVFAGPDAATPSLKGEAEVQAALLPP